MCFAWRDRAHTRRCPRRVPMAVMTPSASLLFVQTDERRQTGSVCECEVFLCVCVCALSLSCSPPSCMSRALCCVGLCSSATGVGVRCATAVCAQLGWQSGDPNPKQRRPHMGKTRTHVPVSLCFACMAATAHHTIPSPLLSPSFSLSLCAVDLRRRFQARDTPDGGKC